MDTREKSKRLHGMLSGLSEDPIDSLLPDDVETNELIGLLGSVSDRELENARIGLSRLHAGRADLTADQAYAIEAIVMPRHRPVAFIQNGRYDDLIAPWTKFNEKIFRSVFEPSLSSIGRIEVPNHEQVPYGGTGFVVSDDLIMTNRHVAELFATGIGVNGLRFRPGQTSGIDFLKEEGSRAQQAMDVTDVVMIHPYWDMALLRVIGLGNISPLSLSVESPFGLHGRDIAVIGYPAKDPRNDEELQEKIFKNKFGVKRIQPGRIRNIDQIKSFGAQVDALTHDASTLGGNSGSCILDGTTGDTIGLHFAGRYLQANYSVPMYELARDPRVTEKGLNFVETISPSDKLDGIWRRIEPAESPDKQAAERDTIRVEDRDDSHELRPGDDMSADWEVPILVSVRLGAPRRQSDSVPHSPTHLVVDNDDNEPQSAAHVEAFPMQVPVIHGELDDREGYNDDFLGLSNDKRILIPKLTREGLRIAAKLDDGTHVLKYHKFSVVMHKHRRLALFTAANVDWRASKREIDGREPTRRELSGLPPNTAEQWVTDPRIPNNHQLPDVFFTEDRASFDKGHLVRRNDICWGPTFDDIQKGNGDTYHTTNCSPQTKVFNRSNEDFDNWGDLENFIEAETDAEKVIIFAGPVLKDDDPFFEGRDIHGSVRVQIPQSYWKIVIAKKGHKAHAFGFVLHQDLSEVDMTEMTVSARWQGHMKKVREIEEMLGGLVKFQGLREIDRG